MAPRWLTFDSLVNARDLAGAPSTTGGVVGENLLYRSDNLQDLTLADLTQLTDQLRLSDVIDLRTAQERARFAPGPLATTTVRHHGLSLYPDVIPDGAELPWQGMRDGLDLDEFRIAAGHHYFNYLLYRPDSVVGALRVLLEAEGATLIHCAAGKDRTGTLVAVILKLLGVSDEWIIADYAASSERIGQIMNRLRSTGVYAQDLTGQSDEWQATRPITMRVLLGDLRAAGGPESVLAAHGWRPTDTKQLRRKLLADA
ncbi:MAG: protein-tyrosine-phosphatase [Propionibacterium sp.]|nr:MAG: protein-tyrosine-phosphatase [Propionibacterium sp.]